MLQGGGAHPDEAILHEVQPLLNAQAAYIEQLEAEIGTKGASLANLEATIGQMGESHEKQMEELRAKFKHIDDAYRQDAVETHK